MPAMAETAIFTRDQLTGRARNHLSELTDPPCALHNEVVAPFLAMRAAAAADGIDLVAFSSFRDFDRQLAIWNGKFRGERPMQDRAGKPLDALILRPEERVAAILWWSALPGASRHHWGTDIDVIDAAAMPENYRLRLLPEEFAEGGIFHRLGAWLDANIARFGFFRPYGEYRGGVYPEPWHLSHAAISAAALERLTPGLIADTVRASEVLGREQLLAQLPEIYRRYVVNISPPPGATGAATAIA